MSSGKTTPPLSEPAPQPPPGPLERPEDLFHQMFEVHAATTMAERHLCQRIRYQVYCLEQGWASEVETDDDREVDSFDERSDHILLTFRRTAQPVGTVRLVLPDNTSATAPALPIQELTPSPLNEEPSLPLNSTGEISRFSVSKEFRRRQGEERYPDVNWTPDEQRMRRLEMRSIPNISIGLIRGIFVAARGRGLTHLCATMEPTLIKLMGRIGINFVPLGPVREHHGLRQPCYCCIDDVNDAMRLQRPELHPIVFDA